MSKRWRIAIIVQRYGIEVNGGAELAARWLAGQLLDFAEVHVFTTCAVDYHTWADYYPPGRSQLAGINLHRYPVDSPRDWPKAQRQTYQLLHSEHSLSTEIEWMKSQGPMSTPLLEALEAAEDEYDIFLFFTYLYATTYFGLPLVSHKAILIPTAHDEPFLRLELFRKTLNLPKAIIYSTESERRLVNRIVKNQDPIQIVVGVGVNVSTDGSGTRFHQRYGLEGDFLLYVGRVDESKNVPELLDFYNHYYEQRIDAPKLVLIGKSNMHLGDNPGIVHLGFVSEEIKYDALAAATVVVIPSLFESLSLIALESWLMKKPIIANGHCEVLKEQCRRSNGGLYYYTYQEFAEILDRLVADSELRQRLGIQGQQFVDNNYHWDIIRAKYLALFKMLFP